MLESVTLSFPHLPACLDGLRLAHLTDFHIRRGHDARDRADRIAGRLASMRLDLALFTGDYMDRSGDEATAAELLSRLLGRLRPRLGCYGVFGNHDNPDLRRRLGELDIHWLDNTVARPGRLPLALCGLDGDITRRPDPVELAGHLGRDDGAAFRILLSHFPTALGTASDLGIHLLLAGHTHGGQLRLLWRRALYNSTDLPLHLSAGVLRHRDTLAVVSRGLGETALPLRLFCPRQLPIVQLKRGPLPGERTDLIANVLPW